MHFQREFSNTCASLTSTSKEPFFTETPSFGFPESYEWWRKVSATKTKPPSTCKVKKTPCLSMEVKGEHMINVDCFECTCNLLSDHNMKNKPLFSTMSNVKSVKPKSNVVSDKKMEKTPFLGEEDEGERVRVLSTLKMFRAKRREISLSRASVSENGIGGHRIDFRAKEELTKQGKLCISSSKTIGPVPGIKAGDRFKYRVELIIIGLHSRIRHGIDYMMYNGRSLATCIVAKEGHDDKMSDSEFITYIGEGGFFRDNQGDFHAKDQMLTYGNLAMKNSMIAKNCVRVVRGSGFGGGIYIYDGLYKVVDYEEKRGLSKSLIFEFKLKRCPGQPVVNWNKFKNV